MKSFYKPALIIAIILVNIVILFIIKDTNNKTLMLPEEICQATKGDHMQYYERNDTIFLEYTFARKPELQPKIQGQQVTVGEDINYKQNDVINVDTLKKLYKEVSVIANSLK